jgi:hypothetical protein
MRGGVLEDERPMLEAVRRQLTSEPLVKVHAQLKEAVWAST